MAITITTGTFQPLMKELCPLAISLLFPHLLIYSISL